MEQLVSVRSLFKETEKFAGQTVKVGGWVRNLRASKNFGFINLSDGTFFSQVQIVYGAERDTKLRHTRICSLKPEYHSTSGMVFQEVFENYFIISSAAAFSFASSCAASAAVGARAER